MKRIAFIGFFLLTLLGTQVFGQVRTVTGTVTDAADGSTLPGVTVLVKGTTTGTVTDIDGRYEVNAASDAVLVFSFIGMTTQEVPVEGRSVINISLESDVTSLEEVVVVGYGTAKTVGTVVGSLTTVNSEQLESKPSANVLDAMQGRVSGLSVLSSSGEPTETASMRLHGVGSLGSSSTPLYVLDGAPISPGNVLSINPNDIESVTVLKDASATSIYGSRAANGVVYITTKRGKLGESAKITVNSQYGVSSLANPGYYDQFMTTSQLTNFWIERGTHTQAQIDALLEANPHDTNWEEYFLKSDAPTYQADLSIQGGGGRTRYYVSGGYFFQDGLATRSEYERYSARANITSHANDWLSFGANLGLGYDERQVNPNFGAPYLAGGLFELLQPFYSPWDENGEPKDFIDGLNMVGVEYAERMQPSDGTNAQLNLNGYIQLNPLEGLTIRSQVGLDGYDWRQTTIRYPSHISAPGDGFLRETFSRSVTRSITNTAEYKFNYNLLHDFTILGGQEYVDNDYSTQLTQIQGLTDDRIILLGAGDPETLDSDQAKSEYAFSSFFGRIDYSFDRKYFVDFSLRQDQSSRFGRENNTANFWAAGFMWDLKKESFLENLTWLSTMNFKASYGTSGNSEIGNYTHQATVGTMTTYGGGSSWIIATAGNPRLTWENQAKATIGAKFSLFEERYRFNVEYYNRKTESMLVSVPQPYTSGFSSIMENVGTLVNQGVDIEFNFDVVKGRDYFVTPYVNFGYNTNKVTELFQGLDYWIIPNTGVAWVVGQPLSFIYPYFAGIDPEDGAPMWYVPGDDPTETHTEETTKVFSPALEQNVGVKRYPPVIGGFGLQTAWNNFSLNVDFVFVNGKYLINNDRYFYENPTAFSGFNQSINVLDYWKEPGDVTQFPSLSHQFTQFDNRLLEDASFIRLKNLTLAYSLPASLLQSTNFLQGSKIFVTGRNLLTFTNYSGPDPEVDSNLSMGVNPNTRQITVGVSLTF